MSQRHSSTVQIHFLFAQAEELQVCQRDDAEGFVDFEGVDGGLFDSGVMERFRDGEAGCRGEFAGGLRGVAPAEDFRERVKVVRLQEGFGDEDDGRCAVR